MKWNETQIQICRDLAADGLTAAQIADAMPGRNRNMIISAARRYTIQLLNPHGGLAHLGKTKEKKGFVKKTIKKAKVNPLDIDIEKLFVGIGAVAFMETKDIHCRWPLEQLTVCGSMVDEYNPNAPPRYSYCPRHRWAASKHE